MTESAPATNRLRRYRSPCLLMLPSLSLPPLECCFGTSPIQAEKLRPDRKVLGSATLATRAVASIGPTSFSGFDPKETFGRKIPNIATDQEKAKAAEFLFAHPRGRSNQEQALIWSSALDFER